MKKTVVVLIYLLASISIAASVVAEKDDFIDVLIKGVDDGKKTSKSQDYKEALMAAKLEAIERAGVEIESVLEMQNFKLKYHHMESKAKGVLLPGFKVMDMGYQKDGTYQVVLAGQIKRGGFSETGAPSGDCSADEERFDRLLGDLTSQRKIKKIVNELVTIPFDLNCGKVHFNAVARFSSRKIADADYRHFLIKTAYEIEQPDKDSRASSILRYLASDGTLDDVEWKAMIEIIKKGSSKGYYDNFYYFFTDRLKSEESYNTAVTRLDDFFEMAAAGEIRPELPEAFDQAFYSIGQAVSRGRIEETKKQRLIYHIFTKYYDKVESKPNLMVYKSLKDLYESDAEFIDRQLVLKWLCTNFNEWPPGKRNRFANEMWTFMKFLKKRIETAADKDAEKNARNDFDYYISTCLDKFVSGLERFERTSESDRIILFFIRNDIRAPGKVLTIEELADNLYKEEYKDRSRAAKLLEKLGEKTIVVEDKIINLISRPKRIKNQQHYINTISSCLLILGNSGTDNPRAHNIIVKYLKTDKYNVSSASQKAVLAFGQKLLPMILEGINECDIYTQLHIVRTVGKMVPLTPESEKVLQQAIPGIKNKRVKSDLEELFSEF